MEPGDKVLILPDAKEKTREYFGWNETMDSMIGRVYTLNSRTNFKSGWIIYRNNKVCWQFPESALDLIEKSVVKHRLGVCKLET